MLMLVKIVLSKILVARADLKVVKPTAVDAPWLGIILCWPSRDL